MMRIPPKHPSIEETEDGLRKHVTEVTSDDEAFDRFVRAVDKEYPNTIVAKEAGVGSTGTVRKWKRILERIRNGVSDK